LLPDPIKQTEERTMIRNFLVAIGGLCFATTAMGSGNGVWADGYVSYIHPNGNLVDRECSIFVPARGQGEVALRCGSLLMTSDEFATERSNGQTIFTTIIRNVQGAPEGAVAKYRGSYMRGSNKAVYYGDVFSTMDPAATLSSDTNWQYAGGFMFAAAVNSPGAAGAEAVESGSAGDESAAALSPVQTVPYLDLNRYLGKWYEIASFPQSFQKGCVATTAEYSLRRNGKIDVRNECRLDTLDGPAKVANGVARVVDRQTNAKLKVTFFWPFSGDYWVIDLDSDYRWAVVGDPSRDYLWILSRTPQLDEALYQDILTRLQTQQGYDISRLQKTLQPGPN
jgi:apolipoprotein D and lipocalin family protein